MGRQLADRIRFARRLAGLTQSQAARMVAVHRGTFGHWERGAGHQPTSANLLRLAMMFGVSYEWLATGRGEMRSGRGGAQVEDRPDRPEDEEQLLFAFRKVARHLRPAIIEFACAQIRPYVEGRAKVQGGYEGELPRLRGSAR